jgi:hypothetical protein
MQIKKPLRYFSASHAVYQQVKLHFSRKGKELPLEWESLVAMACFPGQVLEQPIWTSDDSRKLPVNNPLVTPFEKELRAFQTCFARDPDLALEILTVARKHLASYDEKNCVTQDSRVRAFLVKYGNGSIVSNKGKLRLPKKNEFAEWTMAELRHGKRRGKPVKLVSVATLQDGQIAELLTRPGSRIPTASVTKARQALSTAFNDKGRAYYLPNGLLKRKN